MDGKMVFSPIFFFFILLLLIYLVRISKGLRIELIHPLSPESPYYDPNITYSKMMERFLSQPKTHRMTNSNISIPRMKVIRSVLKNDALSYYAKLNLGTFQAEQPSYKSYYLLFDTGGAIIWLECEDCAKPEGYCFGDPDLAYPNSKSSTYKPLLYNHHPLCFRNKHIGQQCSYQQYYGDGSHTIGILANENFTFNSFHTHPAETVRIVIGCGIRNKLTVLDAKMAGIMGMGSSPHSFINQIKTHSQGRFSYCLPPLSSDEVSGQSTTLHFGPDIPTVHGLHSLTIHRYQHETPYYVELQGISISNKRLHIPPESFSRIRLNKGGCFFDTGTTLNFISRQAYKILKEEMIHHLSTVDRNLKVREPLGAPDLCFEQHPPLKGFAHLPNITFHFEEGADFVMQHDVAFATLTQENGKIICMTITTGFPGNIAIIGASGQANHFFLYDLPAKKIYFAPRDCAQNP